MDKYAKYWIWLQCCLGTDSKKLKAALDRFITPENVFRANENELRFSGVFSERELSRLMKKELGYSENAVESCERLGIDIISFGSPDYPVRLAQTATPPVVLYVKGKLPPQKDVHIGVVGTRNPDSSGKKLAYSIGYDLAEKSAVVVSGGAYGVDIYSHKGCLKPEGKTICILGCGIDMFKSKVSDFLLSEVPKNGAVVSEYPPKYPPTVYTFPARDRIISGMSDCIATVQAGLGSGALITVKFALAQKRKVFAFPGNMDNPFASGTNYMLRCGFSAALCADDILSWVSRRDLEGGSIYVNPELSEYQMLLLSTKPEELILRNTDDLEMPSSSCYEYGRVIAVQDKSAGTLCETSGQRSFYDEEEFPVTAAEAEPQEKEPAKEASDAAAQEQEKEKEPEPEADPGAETFADESSAEELIEEQESFPPAEPLFTMDKKVFSALFSANTDINELTGRMNEENRRKAAARAGKKKKHITRPNQRTWSPVVVQNAQHSDANISESAKKDERKKKISTEQLTSAAVSVYDTISDTPIFTDVIKAVTGLSAGEVLASLTELELYGYIERLPGNKFVRK